MAFDIISGAYALRPPASPAEWATYFAIQSATLFNGGFVPPPRFDKRGEPYLPLLFLLNGEIVGTLVIDKLDRRTVAFRRVAIAPNRQGEGLGAALMEIGEKLAANLGAWQVVLHAKANALGFYQRIGYVTVDWDEPCAFPGSVNMGRALDAAACAA